MTPNTRPSAHIVNIWNKTEEEEKESFDLDKTVVAIQRPKVYDSSNWIYFRTLDLRYTS